MTIDPVRAGKIIEDYFTTTDAETRRRNFAPIKAKILEDMLHFGDLTKEEYDEIMKQVSPYLAP